tara:strand:- start:6773 stop:7930 length:1158 start_codon:yes stop_codon:yes gene_type:complete
MFKFIDKLRLNKLFTAYKILKNLFLNNYSKYPSYVFDFEHKISKKFRSKYCLSFANATLGCQTAMKAVGLKNDDKVLISKLCFPSTFLAILRSGYSPILADFDRDLNIIVNEKIFNENLEAFCVSHLFGYPLDLETIKTIRNKFPQIKIISDCSHIHGANVDNKNIVNYSDIAVMSLQGAKAISSGEGGVAFTDNINYFNSMIQLSHPSRKILNKKNFDDYPGFSKIMKARMHPFGAILASEDLDNIENKNKILREKFKIIYSILNETNSIYLPKVNLDHTGGYHYGLPFFITGKKNLVRKKINFNCLSYNYPKYEFFKEFQSKESYENFVNSDLPLDQNYFNENNMEDLRDDMFIINLDWIKKNNEKFIISTLEKFKSSLINDL